jgi:hypothetical protein
MAEAGEDVAAVQLGGLVEEAEGAVATGRR